MHDILSCLYDLMKAWMVYGQVWVGTGSRQVRTVLRIDSRKASGRLPMEDAIAGVLRASAQLELTCSRLLDT